METVIIKEEPIDYENVSIKIEPQDESDSNYGCIIFKDDFDFKLEIKQEPDDKDDYMSPSPSNPLSPESTCRVVILEQPLKKVRFRYLSELQGTPHGPLLGERSTKTNKTFPKVQLVGYEGREPVKIRCWLVDKTEIKGEVRPHCHDLVVRKCIPRNDIVCEPHEVSISRENNYTALFENMVVLHCVQKDSECKYFEKEVKWNSRGTVTPAINSRLDKKKIRDKIRSINKNEVYLFFEAYIEYRNSVVILCNALSNSIKNLKNPVSGDLKICRAMNHFGPCDGDTEVGLFTEKVPPDVKVKFFCHDRQPMWETIVSPEFMHRHVALTFRTPKLPFNIEDNLKVKYCLYRESDGVVSNAMDFTYQPSELMLPGIALKRRRIESSLDNSDSNGSDEVNSLDINIDNFYQNGTLIDIIGEEVSPSWIQNISDEINSTDIDNIIHGDDSNSANLENFSGSSIEQALGHDPLIGGNCMYTVDQIESDGPIYGNVNATVNGIMNSSNSKDRSKLERIIKNILLTKIYTNHVNCLQKAVMSGHIETLKNILNDIKEYSRSKEINILDKKRSPLLKHIPKITNDKHQTLLHTAVLFKRKEMVQTLIDFGYDPLAKDYSGNNAFHMSVMVSSCDTLQALISSSVEPYCNKNQQSTIKVNLQRGVIEKKKLQSNVLSITNFDGQNVLHLAVRSSSPQIVNYILDLKLIDIQSQIANSGDSALHIACRLQKHEIALSLIQNGADISQLNLQGYSPLHISVAINDHRMAKLLIEEKGDPTQECVSLTREIQSNDLDCPSEEDLFTTDKDSAIGDTYQSNDAFALANDLMMVNILSGKISSLKLAEDVIEPTSPKPTTNDVLLTSYQIDKLSTFLSENDSWKLVVKKLNKPHLEMLYKDFKQPEKILLNYINMKKNEIFGKDNQLGQLMEIFTSLNLNKAKEILLLNED